MGRGAGAQDGRGLVGSASIRIWGATPPAPAGPATAELGPATAELVWSCLQWSTGTSSGQSCPGGPTMCRSCRRHSGRVSPHRTSDSGAWSSPTRPPASRPRLLHPRSDKAVLPTRVSVSPRARQSLHARPGHVSPTASLWASASLSKVGRDTNGPLGLSKLGWYTHPHAVSSDPEQVGGSGGSGCLPGPSSSCPGEPDVRAGLGGPLK